MTERIHDDDVDTSEVVARALLVEQCPQWAGRPLQLLRSSGTDNTMWRLGNDLVMRLPRMSRAVDSLRKEVEVLPLLGQCALTGIVQVPELHHAGEPDDTYPFPWAVFGWIDGNDVWQCRDDANIDHEMFAVDLAGAVEAIAALPPLPLAHRAEGDRGGPLPALLDELDRWLHDPRWSASTYVDVAAIERSAAESREAADSSGSDVRSSVVHGDLIAGNLVLHDRRLHAIIDWGGAAYGDRAQDLAPAWSVLDHRGRRAFREALGIDDATWLRARAFELEHAVGAIVYYTPRKHELADVMSRTLRRILTDE